MAGTRGLAGALCLSVLKRNYFRLAFDSGKCFRFDSMKKFSRAKMQLETMRPVLREITVI